MNLPKTRSTVRHSLLGNPLPELPLTELPTALQVSRHFRYLKDSKYSNHNEAIPAVSQALVELWDRAGIPSQTLKNVKRKVSRLTDACSKATRHGRKTQKSKTFKDSLSKLFDIASCQCHNFDSCRCERGNKVPQRERAFLMDQRSARTMSIGGIDQQVTGRMKRRLARELREDERRLK